jgi:DNA-binding winged helix-turn-helix (wHTH) protein/TolB-like protein/Tfp pilus assembly protein PilF
MPKSQAPNELYEFDSFRLDVLDRSLWRGDRRIPVPDRAFETLCALVRHGNRLVSKDQLMREVWKDTVVEENNLAKSISALRKTLGEQAEGVSFIETVRGRGFRFVADVRVSAGTAGEWDASEEADSACSHAGAAVADPTEGQRRSRLWLVPAAIAVLAGLGVLEFKARRDDKPPGGPITSVAVLPFVNVVGERELSDFSDGLGETLLDRLTALPQLRVVPRRSSFRYRGGNVDPQDAANALGVEAVVTGRVERRGDALWIRVELIDARDNKQVWGAEFGRRLADPLLTQQEIARLASDKMRLHFAGAPQHVIEQKSANWQAYEPLLRGDFHLKALGGENGRKAVEAYQQAIAIDPDYALAHTRLSESYRNLVNLGIGGPRELTSMALSAAQRASELDPDLAEAQLELANLHLDAWNWAEADARFQHAIELNPNLSRARRNYTAYLSIVGRSHDAIAEANRTRHLDPQTLSSYSVVAYSFLAARRYDDAIAEYEKAVSIDNTQAWAYAFLGHSYKGKGMFRKAIAMYQVAIRLGERSPSLRIFLGAAYAQAGDHRRAQAILEELRTGGRYVAPGELAVLYTSLGQRERAFALLEEAYAVHDPQLQYLIIEPGFDPLRDDPRYGALLERVGLRN